MRGNCLDGIALLSLAQAPVAGEPCRWSTSLPPAERLAAHGRLIVAGASRRTGLSPSGDRWAGLGERSKPAVAVQWQGCAKGGHSAMAWRTALKRDAASHGACDVSVFRHTGNAMPPNSRLQADIDLAEVRLRPAATGRSRCVADRRRRTSTFGRWRRGGRVCLAQFDVKGRARQMGDRGLQGIKAVVERQQSMPSEGDDDGVFLG